MPLNHLQYYISEFQVNNIDNYVKKSNNLEKIVDYMDKHVLKYTLKNKKILTDYFFEGI